MVKYFVSTAAGTLEQLERFAELCWIDMVSPTDDDVDDVVEATGISEDMIKAALDEEERSRIEVEDEVILTLKTVGDVVDYIEKHQ